MITKPENWLLYYPPAPSPSNSAFRFLFFLPFRRPSSVICRLISGLSLPHPLLFQSFLRVSILKTLLFQSFLEVFFATAKMYGQPKRDDPPIEHCI